MDPRLVDLLARKPVRLATVAMADKMAQIVWAVTTHGEEYRKSHTPMLAASNFAGLAEEISFRRS
jgi:transposase